MKKRLVLLFAPLALLAGLALAQTPAEKAPQRPADTAQAGSSEARVIKFQLPSYPLDTCPISGEKLGSMGEPVNMVVDGHLVRLCCGSCKKGVEKDKAVVIKKIEEAVVAQQSIGYPMEKCPISGEKMEKPIDHVVGTRLVRFCSDACIKSFDSDPAKQADAMGKLDNAWKHSQKAKYTVTTCPVSGETLDDKAVDYMYGTKLVRLCCNNCVKDLEKAPDAVLAKLETLKKAAPASAPKGEEKKPERKGDEKKGG